MPILNKWRKFFFKTFLLLFISIPIIHLQNQSKKDIFDNFLEEKILTSPDTLSNFTTLNLKTILSKDKFFSEFSIPLAKYFLKLNRYFLS